jgi:anti-sigma-K factor RskA
MKLAHPDLQSRLASEYVLGTLRGPARRRFETYLLTNAGLREAVARWETNLTPLAENVPAMAPPDRVWQKIEARVGKSMGKATVKTETPASTGVSSQNRPKAPANAGLWASLSFWRGLGFGATALASFLLVSALFLRGAAEDPMLMAVLEDQGDARMVVEQPKSGYVMVKMVKPWKAEPAMSMELWVITKDGKPKSLGLINEFGETKLAMPDMDARLSDGTVIALSKEPKGGSPTGLPTGMVLCKGVIARMPAKGQKKVQGAI